MRKCERIGCHIIVDASEMFCDQHKPITSAPLSMSQKYPKYYKNTQGMSEVDVYAVHKLFDIQDPSGAIQHASKKLLLSGVRTGGKSKYDDIREARDTLNRWLELNKE